MKYYVQTIISSTVRHTAGVLGKADSIHRIHTCIFLNIFFSKIYNNKVKCIVSQARPINLLQLISQNSGSL